MNFQNFNDYLYNYIILKTILKREQYSKDH